MWKRKLEREGTLICLYLHKIWQRNGIAGNLIANDLQLRFYLRPLRQSRDYLFIFRPMHLQCLTKANVKGWIH